MRLQELIKEGEFKLEALPESYFINYFEKEFLPKLKQIYKELAKKCNQESDSLSEVEFKNELNKIIG